MLETSSSSEQEGIPCGPETKGLDRRDSIDQDGGRGDDARNKSYIANDQ